MHKKSKSKKRQYKSDTKDIIDLATFGIKAGVVVGVANSVLGTINNK